MKRFSGRESCEMIRNFEKQKDRGEKRIPIFAITANTWETKEQLLSQGFDDVLYKPISLNDLRNKIMELNLGIPPSNQTFSGCTDPSGL